MQTTTATKLESITQKVAKLLALAENAGTEAEAEAAFAKAQSIATAHSIEIALINQNQKDNKIEVPMHQRIVVGERGKHANGNLIELFHRIAMAQGVKVTIMRDNTAVNAYGMPSDVQLTEQLWISISQQMVRFCNAYLKQGEWRAEKVFRKKVITNDFGWRDEIWDHFPMTMQSARNTYQENFIYEVGDRLKKAADTAVAEAKAKEEHFHTDGAEEAPMAAQGVALALVSKKDEVDAYFHRNSNARGSWQKSRGGAYSHGAAAAGKAAGARANIGGNAALGGGRGRLSA